MSEVLLKNQALAVQYLQCFREQTTGHFIQGEWLVPTGAETFENLTPIDNSSLGQVVAGTPADADQAKDGLALMQAEHTNFTVRSPLGPVAVITPWNTPFMRLIQYSISISKACKRWA